jgi:hypothetical protein
MEDIRTAVILEKLDDEIAMFVGGDVATVERTSILGNSVSVPTRYPVIMVPKDSWMDMGCPVQLNVTLAEYVVSDTPGE